MSTIYVFHEELPAAATTLAAGDIIMAYQTATKLVKKFTGDEARALLPTTTGMGYVTTTEVGGVTTLNARAGRVTTAAQTVTQTGVYTLTVTNSFVTATSIVHASLRNGTNTLGFPVLSRVTPAAGAVAFTWTAADTTQPLSGTLQVDFVVLVA